MPEVLFSGNSRFATDFSQIIDRAVSIASLPLVQLEQDRARVSDQQVALNSLDGKFENLQSALLNLQTAAAKDEFNTSISDGNVVKTTVGGTVLTGTYTVDVLDFGGKESALSQNELPVVTDPTTESISASTAFTLTVGGVDYALSPANSSLVDLADAINSSEAGVTATIVNVGPSSAPDYRLSLQAQELGPLGVQLNDGSADLLDTISAGSQLQYTVNGSATILSSSRSVTLAPGLTADFLSVGTANITVGTSTTGIVQSLTAFVSAFNDSVAELDIHRGENPGALAGSSVLSPLSDTLRSLSSFTQGDLDLSGIGLTLSKEGTLQFEAGVITKADATTLASIREFLGDGETSGFVKFAVDSLNNVEDAETGLIESAKGSLQDQISRQTDAIAVQEERLEALATDLQARMAAADSLIASLEQQVQQVTALFEAIREGQAQNR